MWEARFPGQIYTPQPAILAFLLPEDSKLLLDNRWVLQAIECGHSDTYDSTVLWVLELKLAVCGDVVYGQVHQMLFKANTKAKREEWIRAMEKVEELGPVYVVPGHKYAEEINGVWHLAATKKYIEDFGKVAASGPKDPTEVFTQMADLYQDRFNPAALRLSSVGGFSKKESTNSRASVLVSQHADDGMGVGDVATPRN